MKLTPVNIAEAKCPKKDVYHMLLEFANSEHECVRVDYESFEYKSEKSAYSSLSKCVEKTSFPIRVITREGKIFLIKEVIPTVWRDK